MAEIWRCKACGSGTSADDPRLLRFLGWQLQSLRRDGGARAALCPACSDHHDHGHA